MWARSVECIASMGPPEANTVRCYARPRDARPAGTRVMDAGDARRRGFHPACWRGAYLVLRLPSGRAVRGPRDYQRGTRVRAIPLPSGVGLDRIDTRFDNGVPTTREPKAGETKQTAKQIELR